MEIIDFHTHAFPDGLAERAVAGLQSAGNMKPCLDGRISSLLASMDNSGIASSVICSIATKPDQFHSILNWSKQIVSKRIVPFLSVHPEDEKRIEHIRMIKKNGFKGIKLHPYYQNFYIDDEKMFPVYEEIEKSGLILLFHAGYDIAFGKSGKGSPERIVRIKTCFPSIKIVAAHLGGWQDWHEASKYIIGKDIYVDLSISTDTSLNPDARKMILSHPPDRLLFGTDSPWAGQDRALEEVRSFSFDRDLYENLLSKNALELLA